MIYFFQNFISVQDKWEILFWFSVKLTRYLFALWVELLNVFDQIENSCILLAEIETTVCHKLTDENVWRHNFLTEIVKSFFVQHKIVCNQSDFWLSSCLQWQHSNQILCLEICFSNTATVLSVCSECDSCKLVDKHWHQVINLSQCWLIFNRNWTWIIILCRCWSRLLEAHLTVLFKIYWHWTAFMTSLILFCHHIIWSSRWFICWVQNVSTVLNNKIVWCQLYKSMCLMIVQYSLTHELLEICMIWSDFYFKNVL